jgi:hypothetical protein
VLAINSAFARHAALPPVVAPIDDLPGLCRHLGLRVDSIATARSRVEGRRMLGLVAAGKLAVVVKIGPADDAGLQREGAVLERLPADSPPLRVPRLVWAGQWNDRYVVATEAVRNSGAPRQHVPAGLVDVCVALATGGSLGESIVHGDLAPWNLLTTDDGLVLVDWENASFETQLMYDLTHFVVVRGNVDRQPSSAAVVAELVGPKGIGRAYLERLGRDPDLSSKCALEYFDRVGSDYDRIGVSRRYAESVRAGLERS